MYSRALFIAGLFQVISIIAVAQTDKKAAELKNLEVPVANAKARVAMNEKRVAAADSLIDAGKMMINEIKENVKSLEDQILKPSIQTAGSSKRIMLHSVSRSVNLPIPGIKRQQIRPEQI